MYPMGYVFVDVGKVSRFPPHRFLLGLHGKWMFGILIHTRMSREVGKLSSQNTVDPVIIVPIKAGKLPKTVGKWLILCHGFSWQVNFFRHPMDLIETKIIPWIYREIRCAAGPPKTSRCPKQCAVTWRKKILTEL